MVKYASGRTTLLRTIIKRMALIILISSAATYLLLALYVYAKQENMLYLPDRAIIATPEKTGLEFEDIKLITKDGINISAWHIPAKGGRHTIVLSHGNGGNISYSLDHIRIFHNMGLNVLAYDYRGYGKSGGSPSEEGTYLDAEAAYDYLVNVKRLRPENIILFGQSFGGAVSAELALRRKAGALIIDSGFTSVSDMGKKLYPYLPVKLLSRFKYDTINKIDKATIPKLVIHSPEDELIPYEQGLALFNKAAEPKELLQIKGGHNDGFILSEKMYEDGIKRFIEKYL
jgi:fermentation-respiration switch protein FrsA (DUF1100 family)